MAAIGDASRRCQLHLRRKLARLHPCHGCDGFPSAAGVVGVQRPAEERLAGIGKELVVLLLGGDQLGEKIGVKVGFARQRQDGAGAWVHRHNGAALLIGEGFLGRLLQIEVEGEDEILTRHRRAIPEVALHLTHGIHLQHLPAPFPAQMRLVGRFNSGAADAITDLVALLSQLLVFVFRDRLRIAQGMGCQGAMGVKTENIHIHLGALQA